MTNDDGPSGGKPRVSPSAAVTLTEALYDAYNLHDAERAVALYAHNATHFEAASGRLARGRVEILRGLEGFLRMFPDARWQEERRIADATVVAVPYRLTGTLQASLGQIEPQGQQINLRGIHVIHTGGEEITATEDYWDSGTFGSQVSQSSKGA